VPAAGTLEVEYVIVGLANPRDLLAVGEPATQADRLTVDREGGGGVGVLGLD
jgi:hypothetical protein